MYRLLLAVAFPFLIKMLSFTWIAILVLSAALSDFLDGFLARTLTQSTTLGRFLDPIADKVFINVLFFWMYLKGAIPMALLLLVLLRDLSILAGAIVLVLRLKHGSQVAPRLLGKVATALHLLFIVGFFLKDLNSTLSYVLSTWAIPILYTVTLASWLDYSLVFFKTFTSSAKTLSSLK